MLPFAFGSGDLACGKKNSQCQNNGHPSSCPYQSIILIRPSIFHLVSVLEMVGSVVELLSGVIPGYSARRKAKTPVGAVRLVDAPRWLFLHLGSRVVPFPTRLICLLALAVHHPAALDRQPHVARVLSGPPDWLIRHPSIFPCARKPPFLSTSTNECMGKAAKVVQSSLTG